jgi:hypothetical protein
MEGAKTVPVLEQKEGHVARKIQPWISCNRVGQVLQENAKATTYCIGS